MLGYAISHIDDGVFKKDEKYRIVTRYANSVDLDIINGQLVEVLDNDTDFTIVLFDHYVPKRPYLLIYTTKHGQRIYLTRYDEVSLDEAMKEAEKDGGTIELVAELSQCRHIDGVERL